MKKKFKLVRSRLLLPLDEELGLLTRIEDGYVLTEGSLIKEAGKYEAGIGERIIRECGDELRIIGLEKEGGFEEGDVFNNRFFSLLA